MLVYITRIAIAILVLELMLYIRSNTFCFCLYLKDIENVVRAIWAITAMKNLHKSY